MRQTEIQKYISEHKRKRNLLRVLACLAVIVAFGTAYFLIRPATARTLTCTLEEHTHTDTCYSSVASGAEAEAQDARILTCGKEEHSHGENCFSSVLKNGNSNSDDTRAQKGKLSISLLYENGKTQQELPDGVSSLTSKLMSGYIRLEPIGLESDPTDVTVTLTVPKKYVTENSVSIPKFSTNSSLTQYEILPTEEDESNYIAKILFKVYDKTQTLVLPFTLRFLSDRVPDNYILPVTASVSDGDTTEPNLYRPEYKPWGIQKFVNSNRYAAFGKDGAEVVVTPQSEDDNPYLDDLTYVDFAFIVNGCVNESSILTDYRDACAVTLTDTLPGYTDKDGNSCIAVFDAEQNPGWTLGEDGLTVSKTYYGESSHDVLTEIYNDELHLRFPGLRFTVREDGTIDAKLTNEVKLLAVPSNEADGETRPTAHDSLDFRITNDLSTAGEFSKWASKGDIYDVLSYKINPYPWNISLSNKKLRPLQHIVIQDRKIVENGQTLLAGLDEALKFTGVSSSALYSKLSEGQDFSDVVEKVVAYYTDGTTCDYPITETDSAGNFTVTFDADKICNGCDIVFRDDYEMQFGESTRFILYTVYRDPENTHIPSGADKITYPNEARSVNSYQNGDRTEYVYLKAGHSYNMLPSAENLTVSKQTLANNGETLWGEGGNHVGDIYFYLIHLNGFLLEPSIKEYEDIRIVDLLPDGVTYEKIYLIQQNRNCGSILDGGTGYRPEIIENYHNSGRTAVIFHLNGENLRMALKSPPTDIYFGVRINEDAHPGTVRNYVYVVGDNLDEYQGSGLKTEDIYDLNNNGKTDDMISYGYSDATIIAAQSLYAEKFITPADARNLSKQGLSIKCGSQFDYVLRVVNETANDHTGLTVYDTLPQIGDKNIFGTGERGSEFAVRLRSAITPPDGYTVYYTTSTDVYQKAADEMIAADIWSQSVDNYSSVTAFKLTASAGTLLRGQSTFEVTVPAFVPEVLTAESKELLHQKPLLNDSSGMYSYLEAINLFGFSTNETPSVKESNSVWVRLPFAGFEVKKTDGSSGDAIPGAEFTLTDSSGNVVGTATSDANGSFSFREISDGVYTLTETKPSSGYSDKGTKVTVTVSLSKITGDFTVSFGKGFTGSGTSTDPLIVKNYLIPELPATGGIGVAPFVASGALLCLAAATLLFKKRRLKFNG